MKELTVHQVAKQIVETLHIRGCSQRQRYDMFSTLAEEMEIAIDRYNEKHVKSPGSDPGGRPTFSDAKLRSVRDLPAAAAAIELGCSVPTVYRRRRELKAKRIPKNAP